MKTSTNEQPNLELRISEFLIRLFNCSYFNKPLSWRGFDFFELAALALHTY
jgi:hypothetical protein